MNATLTSGPDAGGPPEFTGFPPEFFSFLRELERNNESEWFAANRERFEAVVRGPALAFVRAVAPGLARRCPPLLASDSKARGSMLRMNRDTRFSASKIPYHTSVVLRFPHRGADARTAPCATLRLSSRMVLISAGVRPGGAHTLGLLRAAIDADRGSWAAVRDDRALRAAFGDLAPPELVRVPRGWPPEHPFADDLRRKSFHVVSELPISATHDAAFVRQAVAAWASAAPLLRFVCSALGLDWDAASAADPCGTKGSGSASRTNAARLAAEATDASEPSGGGANGVVAEPPDVRSA